MALFDSVIQYLLPSWEYTAGTYSSLETIRQLLPLSRRRQGLIENCLRESQGATPSTMARIYINRHLAAEHLVDPSLDPEAKNSIFNQVRVHKCIIIIFIIMNILLYILIIVLTVFKNISL